MYRLHSTDKYLIEKDSIGNYLVTRRKDGFSIYMQGDDASTFEQALISCAEAHEFDYECSCYDDVMQQTDEPDGYEGPFLT